MEIEFTPAQHHRTESWILKSNKEIKKGKKFKIPYIIPIQQYNNKNSNNDNNNNDDDNKGIILLNLLPVSTLGQFPSITYQKTTGLT